MMSKRQQARNEKALQDLVHSVPGNNSCADCYARNPAWASWSLGIFLCMRCAAIHRKLGTHISKVKSLSMDGWTNEQLESMKKVGNTASNKIYNPDNKQPPVPVDADEADSAMERFIRAKYVSKTASGGNGRSRRSAESDEGVPPPPPPKTGGFFKKKTSSTFPLSFRSKKSSHHAEDDHHPRELRNKPSKVFGATVNDDTDDMARKLTQLRDMGFMDDKRNAMVLKGVNGNLEKTIETLVRLGEGSGRKESFVSPDALPIHSPGPATPTTEGYSRTSPSTTNSPAVSNNPWDISPAPPQSSHSTGTMPQNNPFYSASTNPFGAPSHQDVFGNMNQSMQNLSLAPSQPAQHLFPHHTGGLPAPPPVQQSMYQQSMTPPIPQSQNFASFLPNGNHAYQQSYQQQQQPQQSYNPFLQPSTQQQTLAVNTSIAQSPIAANNPFAKSPTRMGSPLGQIPEQSQQNFYGAQTSPSYGNNPFLANNQAPQQLQQYQQTQHQPVQPFDQSIFQAQPPQQPHQPQMYQQQQSHLQQQQQQPYQSHQPQLYQQQQLQQQQQSQFQQQQMPQAQQSYQPSRDKASIMALFNSPTTAPSPLQAPGQNQANGASSPLAATQQNQPMQAQAAPQQNLAMPGTKNPFLNAGAPPAQQAFAPAAQNPSPFGSARSRESMNLGMEMAWNNGRHSPDAFASLSARGT